MGEAMELRRFEGVIREITFHALNGRADIEIARPDPSGGPIGALATIHTDHAVGLKLEVGQRIVLRHTLEVVRFEPVASPPSHPFARDWGETAKASDEIVEAIQTRYRMMAEIWGQPREPKADEAKPAEPEPRRINFGEFLGSAG